MQQDKSRHLSFGAADERARFSLRMLASVVAAGSLVLASCTSTPAAPTAAPAAPASAATSKPAAAGVAQPAAGAAGTLTLAGINALTGQSAAPGTRTQHGAELAVKEMNDAGGLKDNCGNTYTVRITAQDMANDRNQAIALLRGASEDPSVLAVIGPTPSVGLVPMVPVAAQVKMPMIGQGSAPIPEWNRYAYRGSPPRVPADLAMMRKLRATFGFDKIAIVYDQGQDSEAASAAGLQENAKDLGYSVTAAEAYRTGDQDFTTQLTKIKATGVQWLGLLAAPGDLGKLARQVRDMGITANLFAGSGNFQDPTVWDVSGGAINGGYTWTNFDLKSTDPKVQGFLSTYKQALSEAATLQSVWGYDAAGVAMDAAKRACTNSDREKFATALGSTNGYQGLGGRITYKNPPDGEIQQPDVIVTKTTGRGEYELVK